LDPNTNSSVATKAKRRITLEHLWRRFRRELKKIFDLRQGFDDEKSFDNIQASLDFAGENMLLLICAIFIASVGLNINSTAVVIGAMLISPLMGPIVGVGFAIRINDIRMFKEAMYKLFLMVTISVATSTLYFLISPLSQAASELLSRTKPTVYDVMIALFGGVAGILTATRRERTTNVIAGAAIATALMPPLCTVGYGLANLRADFILGAGYLFTINAFFISIATLIITMFMPFTTRHTVDEKTEKMIQRVIVVVGIALLIPSVVTGYRSVREVMMNARVDTFIADQMNFVRSRVLDRKVNLRNRQPIVEITMVGDPLSLEVEDSLKAKLKVYDLGDVDFKLINISALPPAAIIDSDKNATAAANMSKLVSEASGKIGSLELKIVELENELSRYNKVSAQAGSIATELKAVFPNFQSLAMGTLEDPNDGQSKLIPVAIAKWKGKPSVRERRKLLDFLRVRTGAQDLTLADLIP
jgi:uncharacterized hydrophobic protein (TIGR00271 family)